jgi:hypothetical protein
MRQLSFFHRVRYKRELRRLTDLREAAYGEYLDAARGRGTLSGPTFDMHEFYADLSNDDISWIDDEIDLLKTRFLAEAALRFDIELPSPKDVAAWRICAAKRDKDDPPRLALTSDGRNSLREAIGHAKNASRDTSAFWANCIISILSLIVAIIALLK